MPFRWVEAGSDSVHDLQGFVCTQEADFVLENYEAQPPAYQVDIEVHTQDFEPPAAPPRTMLLGYDELELARVCVYELYESGDSLPMHFVKALARATRPYGTIGADQVLSEEMRRLRTENRESDEERGVYGKIDKRNQASRHMLRRNGFEMFFEDEFYEWWGHDL